MFGNIYKRSDPNNFAKLVELQTRYRRQLSTITLVEFWSLDDVKDYVSARSK